MRFSLMLCLVTMAPFVAGQTPVVEQDKPPKSKPKSKPKPKHLLRYEFRAGTSGKFQMLRRVTMGLMGRTSDCEVHLADCSWRVVKVSPKLATVELRIERVRKRSTEGEPGKYDADSKAGDALRFGSDDVGAAMRFEVDARGRATALGGDPEQKRRREETLKLIVRVLPELPVGVGDSWHVQGAKPMQGQPVEIRFKNELVRVRRKKVELSYTMEIKAEQQGATIDGKGSKGTMVFDLGQFVPDRVEQTMVMKVTMNKKLMAEARMQFRLGPVGTLDRPPAKKAKEQSGEKRSAPPRRSATRR